MDNKIVRFLSAINFDEEEFSLFSTARINEVKLDNKLKKMTVCMSLDDLLDIDIFKKLCEKSTVLEGADKVYFKFTVKNNNKLFKEYFEYYFSILKIKCPMLECINEDGISYEENTITFEVLNKIEEDKIKTLKKKIISFMENMGFEDIKIKTIINETKREEFKDSISESKDVVIEIKNEPKIVFGSTIKGKRISIKDIIAEADNVTLEVFVFGLEIRHSDKGWSIFTLKISDYSDSIIAKIFSRDKDEVKHLEDSIKEGSWYLMKGYVKHDTFTNDYVFNIRDITSVSKRENKRTDNALEKRVELHLHTNMSQMDGLISYNKLFKKLNDFGHRAVGVTDKNSIQSFPKLYKNKGDIKVLFGAELFVVNDISTIITSETDESLSGEFVVYDFETTGLNAFAGDSIIEIGAVKIKDGEITDTFSELIDPKTPLKPIITEITKITDKMLKGKGLEDVVFKRFMDWTGKLPMIAHNAKFDTSFIKSAFQKYNFGEFKNTIIDTLEMSRAIEPEEKSHSLSSLVKRYEVDFDETAHHRACYDAEATGKVFYKMINRLGSSFETVKDLNKLFNLETVLKTSRPYHITAFAVNNDGLKNLFKIISYANTKYFYQESKVSKTPRIPKSELIRLKDGIIFGSGCASGEIFESAKTKSEEDLLSMMEFYDFIEVNPPSILGYTIEQNDFSNIFELKATIKKIISVADRIGKPVCATGDVHTLDPDDNIYREILINQKQPGGGFHPLCRKNILTIPNAFLMNTEEMMAEFEFLEDDEKIREIVIENPNKIVDMVGDVEVIKKDKFPPKMENSASIMKDIVYDTAHSIYGEALPEIIETRLNKELTGIISGEYDVIYLIAQKLVKKSNDEGYIVGSRGSVGSSLVATFLNITEVNPLPPHYVCPKCKKSIFVIDDKPLSHTYGSGFDMPDKVCECKTKFNKQGQDIPFETFLGFNADKTPDIDLNFSGEYQAKAHDYTKDLFGEANVFRAGTVTTIAERTAFGFVKGYMEEKGITLRRVEIERLAHGITGIKRTSGQHPGGIIVIPAYKDVFDFTPYQYPAENTEASWYTTHFEFHDIEDNVLKLDILGHDDPTVLKYLCDDVGVLIDDIPLDDRKVLSIFSSPEALGIKSKDIGYEVGTLGIPEFGTNFVMKMLEEIKPKSFAELIKISGLSHGTDVWAGNARDLIINNVVPFKDVIGCRDDIMVYLIKEGIDSAQAFKISEFIRKGKPSKEPEAWEEYANSLRAGGIKEWYIESCAKIKYMFPKAHASAYVTNGFRVAWFKVYHPLNYYRVFLSIRRSDFDIETMISGHEKIKEVIAGLENMGFEKSDKEKAILGTLEVANEMLARGFHFENISLEKSDAVMFKINEDNTGLIPPFSTLDGMGDIAASTLVEERNKRMFVSIEDVQTRGKVSQTLIDKMRGMGILEGLPESSQLSLFD